MSGSPPLFQCGGCCFLADCCQFLPHFLARVAYLAAQVVDVAAQVIYVAAHLPHILHNVKGAPVHNKRCLNPGHVSAKCVYPTAGSADFLAQSVQYFAVPCGLLDLISAHMPLHQPALLREFVHGAPVRQPS
jgi:hypothetical protein